MVRVGCPTLENCPRPLGMDLTCSRQNFWVVRLADGSVVNNRSLQEVQEVSSRPVHWATPLFTQIQKFKFLIRSTFVDLWVLWRTGLTPWVHINWFRINRTNGIWFICKNATLVSYIFSVGLVTCPWFVRRIEGCCLKWVWNQNSQNYLLQQKSFG